MSRASHVHCASNAIEVEQLNLNAVFLGFDNILEWQFEKERQESADSKKDDKRGGGDEGARISLMGAGSLASAASLPDGTALGASSGGGGGIFRVRDSAGYAKEQVIAS